MKLPLNLLFVMYQYGLEYSIVILVCILMIFIVNKRIIKDEGKIAQLSSKTNALITEYLQGLFTIKCHAWEQAFIAKIQTQRTRYLNQKNTVFLTTILSNLIGNICVLIVSIGIFYQHNQNSVILLNQVRSLCSTMKLIPKQISQFQKAVESFVRIEEYLKHLMSQECRENDINVGNIVLRNCFIGNNMESPLLHDISIEIPKNKTTLLIGAAGSAKTSLLLGILGGILLLNENIQF
jgi:ABC-type multidrug transport system fused ATPase/permease subunit